MLRFLKHNQLLHSGEEWKIALIERPLKKEVKLAVNFCFYLNHWGLHRDSSLTLLCGMCRLQKSLPTKGEYTTDFLPAAQKGRTRNAEAILLRDRDKRSLLGRPKSLPSEHLSAPRMLGTPWNRLTCFLPLPPFSCPSLFLTVSWADHGQHLAGR